MASDLNGFLFKTIIPTPDSEAVIVDFPTLEYLEAIDPLYWGVPATNRRLSLENN